MAGEPILVVDDNPLNLKLARLLLASEGYHVRTAEQAENALSALRSFHPRLILMDVQLPGIDGLELTRRLRADPGMDDVVILAVTAYAMKSDEQRALAAGCNGYVAKPIDTRTLPALIREYLRETEETVARAAETPPQVSPDPPRSRAAWPKPATLGGKRPSQYQPGTPSP